MTKKLKTDPRNARIHSDAQYVLYKEFYFEAAHYIPDHQKCGAVHGHSYRVQIEIYCSRNGDDGMILDFGGIGSIKGKVDHSMLNVTIKIPTAENIAYWVWREIATMLLERGRVLWKEDNQVCFVKVTIWETNTSSATYAGDVKRRDNED